MMGYLYIVCNDETLLLASIKANIYLPSIFNSSHSDFQNLIEVILPLPEPYFQLNTMAKTIAVIGATGTQGGGVVKVLLKSGDWKVRAITRNTSSDKVKALASSGAEVVAANTDDLDSLVKAFEVSELSQEQNT